MKHIYPVGATWEAQEGDWQYLVTLDRIDENSYPGSRYEVWYVYIDSLNSRQFEIFPHKESAIKYCKGYMNDTRHTRFKRIS